LIVVRISALDNELPNRALIPTPLFISVIVFVIDCPQQPPQLPMPNDAAEFLGLPAPVIGTGDMI